MYAKRVMAIKAMKMQIHQPLRSCRLALKNRVFRMGACGCREGVHATRQAGRGLGGRRLAVSCLIGTESLA